MLTGLVLVRRLGVVELARVQRQGLPAIRPSILWSGQVLLLLLVLSAALASMQH